jgi:hypothetical protein
VWNTKGTKASEKSGDITGIGDSEGVLGAVVSEREAEKFGGDGVGFDVVEGGKARDKKGEVGWVVVLDAEVVHDQDKGDGARGVTEETGGKGLVEIKRLKKRDETEIGELTCLFETIHRFLYTENDVRLSRLILLNEGEKKKARQDFWGKNVSINFNELGCGKGRF